MNLDIYYSKVIDGFEFLVAFGSLMGLLGLAVGFVILLFGGQFYKATAVKVIIISMILVGICGMYTGVKYFRI